MKCEKIISYVWLILIEIVDGSQGLNSYSDRIQLKSSGVLWVTPLSEKKTLLRNCESQQKESPSHDTFQQANLQLKSHWNCACWKSSKTIASEFLASSTNKGKIVTLSMPRTINKAKKKIFRFDTSCEKFLIIIISPEEWESKNNCVNM